MTHCKQRKQQNACNHNCPGWRDCLKFVDGILCHMDGTPKLNDGFHIEVVASANNSH